MAASAKPAPVRVTYAALDHMTILRQARERHESMQQNLAYISYGTTTLLGNRVGLLGEHAVLYWLRTHYPTAIEHTANDEDTWKIGTGDVSVRRPDRRSGPGIEAGDSITVEVKTNRYSHWREYGRTLNERQRQHSTAAAYVWCVVADTLPTDSVIIMGWLPTDEVKNDDSGHPTGRWDRQQWCVTKPMRDLRDLPDWIDNRPPPPPF